MAEVSIANVRKVYGSTEVIHDLSVKVNDGEFVVLVGPSGCGTVSYTHLTLPTICSV